MHEKQGLVTDIYPQVQDDMHEKRGLVARNTKAFQGISWSVTNIYPFTPAFTLAEVLITLGIIGVVAAMTIPNLMVNMQAKKYRSQYLKAYSEISQAVRMMKYDEVSLDSSTYGSGNSFYKTFYSYFKNAHLCGTGTTDARYKDLCYYQGDYHNFNGKVITESYRFDDGQFVLMDGALVMLENPYSSANPELWIHVDINGKKGKPNRLGVDVFTFDFNDKEELVPMGSFGTQYTDTEKYCNPSSNLAQNGYACSQRAMNESDYFVWALKSMKK